RYCASRFFHSFPTRRSSDLGIYAEFVTNKGTMLAKLYYDKVPTTVANFISLAEGSNPLVDDAYKNKKYYNGLIFHRVMDDFIIQESEEHTSELQSRENLVCR